MPFKKSREDNHVCRYLGPATGAGLVAGRKRMVSDQGVIAPGRTGAVLEAGASLTSGPNPASAVTRRLPAGMTVLVAEIREVSPGQTRVRISSPAGWLNASDLRPTEIPAESKQSFEQYQQVHQRVAPGDLHGLDFPITLEMVHDFGPEFLTAAFRATGVIAADNAVTQIVALDPLSVPGASENALLTVAYARPEPGLKTELFIKLPTLSSDFKYANAMMSKQEVSILELARSRPLHVDVPKSYFGDFSSSTYNYILIIERIPFGVDPVEPAYRKGYDHLVPALEEHYRTLAKAMATLATAHKTGALGDDLELLFPFRKDARQFEFLEDPTVNVDRLIDFIVRKAPQLFPPEASDPDFIARFRRDLLFGIAHKDAIIAYLHKDIDYTALCHPNLNLDNAWFWREPTGELRAGLFDWSGASQMSIALALSGMLMMMIPEKQISIVHDVLETFRAEYARGTGIQLDRDELLFLYKASLYGTAVSVIVQWVVGHLDSISEADYRDMKDRHDSRLIDGGLYAAIVWIDCMLREWLQDVTPGDVCRMIVERGAIDARRDTAVPA
jgi:hypothetical protein